MLTLYSLLVNPTQCDAPEAWQIGFQDGASPTFEGITELHNSIFFYLVVISIGVAWVIGSVVVNFSSNKSPIVYKYANHGRNLLQLYMMAGICLYLMILALDFSGEYMSYTLQMCTLPLILVNTKGKQRVTAVKGKSSTSKTVTVEVVPTPKMKMVGNSIVDNIIGLKVTNIIFYEWLMTQTQVRMLMGGNFSVDVNQDGNLVAENVTKGTKPSSFTGSGVYIFSHSLSGNCYIGSAMSLVNRYLQHLMYASKYRRYTDANEVQSEESKPLPNAVKGKLYPFAYSLVNNILIFIGVYYVQ
ncbi:MAG: hypothetical protein JZD40_04840 [Sulfolobus sp.]|nr:hypothetical protein [Sulfolobus sp.]